MTLADPAGWLALTPGRREVVPRRRPVDLLSTVALDRSLCLSPLERLRDVDWFRRDVS